MPEPKRLNPFPVVQLFTPDVTATWLPSELDPGVGESLTSLAGREVAAFSSR